MVKNSRIEIRFPTIMKELLKDFSEKMGINQSLLVRGILISKLKQMRNESILDKEEFVYRIQNDEKGFETLIKVKGEKE